MLVIFSALFILCLLLSLTHIDAPSTSQSHSKITQSPSRILANDFAPCPESSSYPPPTSHTRASVSRQVTFHFNGKSKTELQSKYLDQIKRVCVISKERPFRYKNCTFETLLELEEWAEEMEDPDLQSILQLKKHFSTDPERLITSIETFYVDDPANAQVVVSTVHQAKGVSIIIICSSPPHIKDPISLLFLAIFPSLGRKTNL